MSKVSRSNRRNATPEHLMVLVAQHIPPFVIQRLQPLKESLRNNMQGLPPERQQALRMAIRDIHLEHQVAFEVWGEQFIALLSEASPETLVTRLRNLPDPPEEPADIWQQLVEQAQQ